jgi:hypothetical protein
MPYTNTNSAIPPGMIVSTTWVNPTNGATMELRPEYWPIYEHIAARGADEFCQVLWDFAVSLRAEGSHLRERLDILAWMSWHRRASFDALRDEVWHGSGDDDAIIQTIKRARALIEHLPVRLAISGRMLHRENLS